MSPQFDVNQYWLERGRTYCQEERLSLPYHRFQETFLIDTLRQSGFPMRRVLELGCGFGRITRLVAAHFPDARITACDLSHDQLHAARTYCQGLEGIEWFPYDFYSADPFPGGPHETAVAVEVFLHHPESLVRSLLERLTRTVQYLAHVDWSEAWSGPLPKHVWLHDYEAYHRDLGWQCVALPVPQKTEGHQQVLFLAGRELPPGLQTTGGLVRAPMGGGLGEGATGREPTSWLEQLRLAHAELRALLPRSSRLILVDDAQWGLDASWAGHQVLPFLERNGTYWGPPESDEVARRELERMRGQGATHLAVAWGAFWWLDHYRGWSDDLRRRFDCLSQNERLILFDLRTYA